MLNVIDDNIRTGSAQSEDNRTANPGIGTGDEGGLLLQKVNRG